MRVSLIVDTPGATVRLNGAHLAVAADGERIATAPLMQLRDVTLIGRVELTAEARHALLQRGVPVVFAAAGGPRRGMMVPEPLAGLATRRAQYAAVADPERRCRVAAAFVRGRVWNARALGLRLTRARRTSVQERAFDEMERALRRLPHVTSLAELRGVEGYATRVWFRVVRTLVPEEWAFPRRTRRPPTNPFSSVLSFAYVIVTQRAALAVLASGADPALGFLHDPHPARPALALDLVEEFRPLIAESAVLNAVRRRIITPNALTTQGDASVRIDAHGRATIAEQVHARLDQRIATRDGSRRYATVMVDQAASLAAAMRDGREYRPFLTR